MVYKCCVPNCRGNYNYEKTGETVTVFGFPNDEKLRQKWITALKRIDFVPTSYTRVCIKHFAESDIIRLVEYTNPDTAEILRASLDRVRLKPTAVPHIIAEFPQQLSPKNSRHRSKISKRKANNEQHSVQLQEQLAIEPILEIDIDKHEIEKKFSNLKQLYELIEGNIDTDIWTTIKKNDRIIFAILSLKPAPTIELSVVITDDKQLQIFHQRELTTMDSYIFPKKVDDFNEVKQILNSVHQLSINNT